MPHPADSAPPASDGAEDTGRGLQLVASLAERWRTRPLAHGKSVWRMVALTPGR
jgi:hypothetical protein